MIRTRALVPAVALAAGLALAACGSSTSSGTQQSSSPTGGLTQITPIPAPTTAAATPTAQAFSTTAPTLVGASAVPAVTGKQGAKPTIAKATQPAPTSLLVHDVITGTGPGLAYGQSATANYTLELYDGTPIQSSYDGGQPFSFTDQQGGVIDGFAEGVIGMKAGGRRELVIPAALGYGDTPPSGSGIPAGANLIFVVDLVSIG